MRLIKKRTDIAFKLLAGSALWVRRLTDLIAEYAKAVPSRLAGYLLAEALRQRPTALADGARVRLAVNKGELAAHLGTVAETLSRAFARLRDDGVIEVEEREITIKDLAALRDLASDRNTSKPFPFRLRGPVAADLHRARGPRNLLRATLRPGDRRRLRYRHGWQICRMTYI